jgi:hypothetical protein
MIDARIRIYQDGWWMIDGGLRSKKHQTTGNISKIYSSISHTWYIGISWEYHPQFTFRYGMVTTSFSTIHLGGLGKASAPSKWLSRSKKKQRFSHDLDVEKHCFFSFTWHILRIHQNTESRLDQPQDTWTVHRGKGRRRSHHWLVASLLFTTGSSF